MNYNLDYIKIGIRIKRERQEAGLTQRNLLRALNMSEDAHSTVSNWERGKTEPSFDVLLRLCSIFDCELMWLLCDPSYPCRTRVASDVHNATGLSEKAVNNILAYDVSISPKEGAPLLNMLNYLLEDVDFSAVVAYIGRYLDATEQRAGFDIALSPEADMVRDAAKKIGLKVVTGPELARLEYEMACEKLKVILNKTVNSDSALHGARRGPAKEV